MLIYYELSLRAYFIHCLPLPISQGVRERKELIKVVDLQLSDSESCWILS